MLDETSAFYRLIEVPLMGDPQAPGGRLDALRKSLVPSLVRAYSAGESAVVTWVRRRKSAPIEVVLGGFLAHDVDPTSDVPRPLYPPGTRAELLRPGELWQTFQEFPSWLRSVGQPDFLTATQEEPRPGDVGSGLEDHTVHLARSPFVWMIIADPVNVQTITDELADLHEQLTYILDRHNISGRERVDVERVQERYKELVKARTCGLWKVHVLAGGPDERIAWQAAALLCSSSDLDRLPYVLRPGTKATSFEEALDGSFVEPDDASSPFLGSTDLLAAIARPPAREVPGVRLVEPPQFDVTPESEGDVVLGSVLDWAGQPAGELSITTSTLNRHTFVCGATGAGKSQTVRHLLEGLALAGIPWLVIEPAKAEYARMAGRLATHGKEVSVIRPGEPDAIPVSLNPLEPEPGFPLQTHIDLVRALFLAAFEAEEPFPQVMAQALTRCYEDLGWDLALSESRFPLVTPRYPRLGDLQHVARREVEAIGYGKEVMENVRGFIEIRIRSLRLGTPGQFFEGGHPMDIADLLRRNVVLEIEDIGNDQDKAFFIGTVLIRLVEHLRVRQAEATASERAESVLENGIASDGAPSRRASSGGTKLRHITVVEEAHRLLKNTEADNPAAHAVELFAGLLAEVRAYGEGIIVAEQIPAKIVPDVIKNTALKIVHRLPAKDDRESVGATMNLDEVQSRHVVTLKPGHAAIFTDGMDHAMLTRIPYGEDREYTDHRPPSVDICRTRGPACGPLCQERACTLREMREAQRFVEDTKLADPRLVLWIEMSVVAHIVGEPEPNPDEEWLNQLKSRMSRRQLHCAIAQLAQSAVDARYHGLTEHYTPEHLATHVASRARDTVDGVGTPCNGNETWWQSGRFRWVDVFRALGDGSAEGGPHPLTNQWRQRGLNLAGDTQEEQVKALRAHPDTWLPSRDTVIGTYQPPAHEVAAARLSNASNELDRLAEAIGFLHTKTDWPEARLYPDIWRERKNQK